LNTKEVKHCSKQFVFIVLQNVKVLIHDIRKQKQHRQFYFIFKSSIFAKLSGILSQPVLFDNINYFFHQSYSLIRCLLLDGVVRKHFIK